MAGAAEGVTAPVLDGVLEVEDGVAGFGVEPDVGDVAGVASFDEDGMGGREGLGDRGLLRLGNRQRHCESEEEQEYREMAVHRFPHLAGRAVS